MALEYEDRKIEITFTARLLATSPANREIYSDYVVKAAKNEGISVPDNRLDTIMDVEEAGLDMFPRLDNDWDLPGIFAYQIKGYLKEAARAANRSSRSEIRKTRGFLQAIKFELHIKPNLIPFILPRGTALELGRVERPIRAQGPTGERVALKASEAVPAGTRIEFTIKRLLGTKLKFETIADELLAYGANRGLGGWRDAGFGTFSWKEI